MKIKAGTAPRRSKCTTCIFRPGGCDLKPGRLAEIQAYLIAGQNHLCHDDETGRTICRGSRNFQLEVWHRMGLISAPTDAALRAAMSAAGVQPGEHI